MSGQILSLSLFLMLLAFFIVMNALSNYDVTRVKPIIQSIEKAFASQAKEAGEINPSLTPDAAQSTGRGDTLSQIESLFQSTIPGAELTLNRVRGTLTAKMRVSAFDYALSKTSTSSIRSGDDLFSNQLRALLINDNAGLPYRMDIGYGIDDKTPNGGFNTQSQKASENAVRLEKLGIPTRLISIGFQKGDPGFLTLTFREHPGYAPKELVAATEEAQP